MQGTGFFEWPELCHLPNLLPALAVESDGSFTIEDVPDGRQYWLIASMPGFRTVVRRLPETGPAEAPEIIDLEPAPTDRRSAEVR